MNTMKKNIASARYKKDLTMEPYTKNENYTIWHNKDTMKFYIQLEGCEISSTPYDTASEAIGSYYNGKM